MAKIVSMRNRLIHGYDDVDYAILWDALTFNLTYPSSSNTLSEPFRRVRRHPFPASSAVKDWRNGTSSRFRDQRIALQKLLILGRAICRKLASEE